MDSHLLGLASRLLERRRSYALATVVHRERPSSASPGNTAVITTDGELHGWIGGSCTQPEVVRHALAALADGRPRLLGFGAAPGERDDLVPVPMSCGSEGKVEVHINPVFPVPQMVVVGSSPIAEAVVRLGKAMGYLVASAPAEGEDEAASGGPGADGDGAAACCGGAGEEREGRVGDLGAAAQQWAQRASGAKLLAVVATMGRGDEQAVQQLAAAKPDYMGVVVSPKRMAKVRWILGEAGLGDDEVARVHGPAGLDIGAESPEEVAVSILAEIVAVGAGKGGAGKEAAEDAAATPAGAPEHATDPVCGMTVPADGSRPSSTHEGRTVHFCCPGCKARFDGNPAAYA